MSDRRPRFLSLAMAIAMVGAAAVAPTRVAADGEHGHEGGEGGGNGGGGPSGGGPGASSSGGGSFVGPTREDSDSGPASAAEIALARKAEADGDARPLGEVIAEVRRIAPGKILAVSFARHRRAYLYAFTVLTDSGNYLDIALDAKSAELISSRRR